MILHGAIALLFFITSVENQVVDVCSINPCQNGGVCTADDDTSFTCTCPPCHFGIFCHTFTDACSINACHNGGVCRAIDGSCTAYACICPTCYSGGGCHTFVNACNNTLCQNGGACGIVPGSCTCDCLPCYTGDFCQTPRYACSTNACENGGVCNAVSGSCSLYTCICPTSYFGYFCQTHDKEPPIVLCPEDINKTTKSNQVTVAWDDPLVSDNMDNDLSATCTPSSGSSFSVGLTDVKCTAIDSAGNEGSCKFSINLGECMCNSSTSGSSGNVAVTIILCLIIVVTSSLFFIVFCRSYYSIIKRLENLQKGKMDFEVPVETAVNTQNGRDYKVNIPDAKVPSTKSEEFNSGYEELHPNNMSVDHPYTDLKK